jgi:inhibitor of KinA sporulation pathway (predicted exonuclease)
VDSSLSEDLNTYVRTARRQRITSMTKQFQLVTKHHADFAALFRGLGGVEMTTAQIGNYLRAHRPESEIQWMQPTDHCVNHTNAAPCECSQTPQAVFEWLGRAHFRVRDLT